jgi:hypothetical protein
MEYIATGGAATGEVKPEPDTEPDQAMERRRVFAAVRRRHPITSEGRAFTDPNMLRILYRVFFEWVSRTVRFRRGRSCASRRCSCRRPGPEAKLGACGVSKAHT